MSITSTAKTRMRFAPRTASHPEAALAYGGDRGLWLWTSRRGDTLYVHADTVRMSVERQYRLGISGGLWRGQRAAGVPRRTWAVCGLLVANTLDSCITLYDDARCYGTARRQIAGEPSIRAFMNDSTVRRLCHGQRPLRWDGWRTASTSDQRKSYAHFIDRAVRRATAVDNADHLLPHRRQGQHLIGMV